MKRNCGNCRYYKHEGEYEIVPPYVTRLSGRCHLHESLGPKRFDFLPRSGYKHFVFERWGAMPCHEFYPA